MIQLYKSHKKKGMVFINIIKKRAAVILAALIMTAACGCGSGNNQDKTVSESGAADTSSVNVQPTADVASTEKNVAASDVSGDTLPPLSYYACFTALDGKNYTMPCTFDEFEKNGWDFANPSDRERYENESLRTDESSGIIELKKTDGTCKDSHVGVIFHNAVQGTEAEPIVSEPLKNCVITTISLGYCHTDGADNALLLLDDGTALDDEITAEELALYYGTPRKTDSGTFTPWWEGASDLTADYVEYDAFYAAMSNDVKNSPYSVFCVWSNQAIN